MGRRLGSLRYILRYILRAGIFESSGGTIWQVGKLFVILQIMNCKRILINRFYRVALSAVTVALSCLAASAADVQAAVDRMVASGAVDAEGTAVLVVDLASGETVGEYNAERALLPASVLKCVTTASLLETAGPQWRYTTVAYIDGRVRDGVLRGNVIVVGSGDPTLNSLCEPLSNDFVVEIVDALKSQGISRIEGRVIIDESAFEGPATPPSWHPDDLKHSYGTGSHGLNFENNARGDRSVANPAAVFQQRLQSALTDAGIGLESKVVAQSNRRKLVAHSSPVLSDIMSSCMMRSDNMFAESLLRTYALRRGMSGSTDVAAGLESDYWRERGLPMEGVNIVDGSGLSRQNRMTARFLGGVLEQMSGNVDYAAFFPLAGQEGTLKKFLADTPLETYIAMKTGSMRGVQCYAGYKVDEDFAPTHVVVIIGNDFKSRESFRKAVEHMLLEAFSDNTDIKI